MGLRHVFPVHTTKIRLSISTPRWHNDQIASLFDTLNPVRPLLGPGDQWSVTTRNGAVPSAYPSRVPRSRTAQVPGGVSCPPSLSLCRVPKTLGALGIQFHQVLVHLLPSGFVLFDTVGHPKAEPIVGIARSETHGLSQGSYGVVRPAKSEIRLAEIPPSLCVSRASAAASRNAATASSSCPSS
jgi:hypothetical protein